MLRGTQIQRRIIADISRSPIRKRILSQPSKSRNFAITRRIQNTAGTPVPPPPPVYRLSAWRRFLQTLGRVTLVTIVGLSGTFYFITQRERHPGAQLPHDPSKKTIVVLGSGWGATSFLKGLDTTEYNVTVISPKNFFLFTPLLPSVAVGTLNARSILQPTRYLTRHKTRSVNVVEAEANSVDPINKTVTFTETSTPFSDTHTTSTINYDYLIYAVGAEVQTFGIKGVQEKTCFMKELGDAEKMQKRFMDCVEAAAFPGQTDEEIDRLLHMVVVGGGPTGVELSGELHDFLEDDLKSWYPELAPRMKITLVEALPSVLPMFSKQLIEYTENTFKQEKIDILTKTMVQEVKDKSVVVKTDKGVEEIPCGMVVWAAGNRPRKLTMDLAAKLPAAQTNKRGLTVNGHLQLSGAEDSFFAIGDCTSSSYAPTAQVASQQGAYLARQFAHMAKRERLESSLTEAQKKATVGKEEGAEEVATIEKQLGRLKEYQPFHYSHQGSLAYIGSDKAIADLPFMNGNFASGGVATYLFWRSAYLSTLFSLRNRTLVATDWFKTKVFGRDVSRE